MNNENKSAFLMAFSLFFLAFIPRYLGLGTTIVADEQLWIRRSISFLTSLLNLDLLGCHQSSHPGVIPMWLASIPLGIANLIFGTSDLIDKLYPAQLPFAFVTSLAVVIIYFMVRKLFNNRTAAISCIIIALDPFYLGFSRIVHVDALLSCFMTLSFLSFLLYLESQKEKKYLLFSGLFAGLATLSKIPAIFLFPFIAFLLFLSHISYIKTLPPFAKTFKEYLAIYLSWALTFLAVIFILWPALWVDPLLFIRIFSQSPGTLPHEHGQFFMGMPIADPGSLFYPVVTIFRTTPLVLILSVLFIVYLLFQFLKHKKLSGRIERNSSILICYVILFIVFMSLLGKKFDRYILPVFPILDIFSAVGLIVAFNKLIDIFKIRANGKYFYWVLLVFVFVLQSYPIVSIYPYYSAYYNPIAGGPKKAQEVLLIGRGEGMDLVAEYLNQKSNPQNITVASEYAYLLRLYFK